MDVCTAANIADLSLLCQYAVYNILPEWWFLDKFGKSMDRLVGNTHTNKTVEMICPTNFLVVLQLNTVSQEYSILFTVCVVRCLKLTIILNM